MPQLNNGRTVRFLREEDMEEPNRGWQMDQVRAEVDGETVGFVGIYYIPLATFRTLYPNVLHYIDVIKGRKISNFDQATETWTFPTDPIEVLTNTRRALHDHRWEPPHSVHERLSLYETGVQTAISMGERLHGREFRDFKQFHVNRPLLDLMHVYGAQDLHSFHRLRPRPPQGVRQERAPSEWRGLGVEVALIKEAALWMAQKGLKLYASRMELESNSQMFADYKAAWNALPEHHLPHHITKRSVYRLYKKDRQRPHCQPRVYVDGRDLRRAGLA